MGNPKSTSRDMSLHDSSRYRVAILCGGRGSRLGPLTERVPKALAMLDGRPILDHILDFYGNKGISAATLCVGYKAEEIRRHFAAKTPGMELTYSDAGLQASILQRVTRLLEFGEDRFLVSYCDTFIDLDLEGLLESHVRSRAQVTIVTAKIRNPFGVVSVDNSGWVGSFVEKPIFNYYIGCFVMERSALDFATPEMVDSEDGSGLVAFFNKLGEKRMLAAFDHTGLQITFNTEPERQAAESHLVKYYTFSEEK
jgi:glucose-1-phosphate cytidylyltransferase